MQQIHHGGSRVTQEKVVAGPARCCRAHSCNSESAAVWTAVSSHVSTLPPLCDRRTLECLKNRPPLSLDRQLFGTLRYIFNISSWRSCRLRMSVCLAAASIKRDRSFCSAIAAIASSETSITDLLPVMASAQSQLKALWCTVMVLSCAAALFLLLFIREHTLRYSVMEQLHARQHKQGWQAASAASIDLRKQPGTHANAKLDSQLGHQRRGTGFEPAAPWTALQGTSFPYHGLHADLEALLEVQASPGRWVSIITMTAAIKRFVLNCVYSMHKYGNWPHFVIATFDTHSLETCIALKLPCLDASSFSTQQVSDGQHSYGSSDAVELWWSKQRLALAILRRGYHVHGCDSDVVYFKSIDLSYTELFKRSGADGIFATEEWRQNGSDFVNFINAGVYAVWSNRRTVRFFEEWTAQAVGVDQGRLNELYLVAYDFCSSQPLCRAVKRRLKKMAIFRHPTFYPGSDGHCIRNSLDPAPCDSRRLYLHQLCGDNHWHVKSQRWDNLTLWFIDDSPQMRPVYADGGGPKGAHPFMPCVDGVAWTGLQQGY